MNNENRNLIIAILLSVGIIFGFNYFFESKSSEKGMAPPQQNLSQDLKDTGPQPQAQPDVPLVPLEKLLESREHVDILTPTLQGTLDLKGARFDDLKLRHYHLTVDPQSPEIILFSPEGTKDPYYAEFGWVSASKEVNLPTSETTWAIEGKSLTPESPLILKWNNGQGLYFERIISIDDQYLFTVTDRVENKSSQTIILNPYGLISRGGTLPLSGYYALYEGPIGVLGGSLNEISYEDVRSKKAVSYPSLGGWIGITDKYWLSALIPDPSMKLNGHFKALNTEGTHPTYQTDFLGSSLTLTPGETTSVTHHLFAGAKVVTLLDAYEQTLNVPKLDRAVDFGWFYLITKPLFYVLTYINTWTKNFGVSILVLTVLVKLLFFPLANKSYKAMGRMKRLQPEIEKLQARYKDDKIKQNQEMMAFYKKHRVNPMAGCLPLLIQIPVFFALYKVLFISLEMRHAPFFGWIHDLSAPDPTTLFNLFGLIHWIPPSFLMIGAWPLIMGVTMILQQKMSPQPADPAQAKVMMVMPIFFTYLLAQFPVGLVIYWAWSNILTIGQQALVMKMDQSRPYSRDNSGKKK